MLLSDTDMEQFYRIRISLHKFANTILEVVDPNELPLDDFFFKVPSEYLMEIRDNLLKNPQIFDEFINKNPDSLSQEDLHIASTWKDYVYGNFFILKNFKKYTILLSEDEPCIAYGVMSLRDEIVDMIYGNFPTLVNAVILPFKGQIIYDGFFNMYNIHFGKNIRTRLNNAYKECKIHFGIVESLPFDNENDKKDEKELLKSYLRTKSSREKYEDEIFDLIYENEHLNVFYHQEMGKILARALKKQYKNAGIKNIWFGLYQNLIVASGNTKKDVQNGITQHISKDEQNLTYIFKV